MQSTKLPNSKPKSSEQNTPCKTFPQNKDRDLLNFFTLFSDIRIKLSNFEQNFKIAVYFFNHTKFSNTNKSAIYLEGYNYIH